MVSQAARGMPSGTVVTVRDLFYNLPARLKFLKSGARRVRLYRPRSSAVRPGPSFDPLHVDRARVAHFSSHPAAAICAKQLRAVRGRSIAFLAAVGLEPSGDQGALPEAGNKVTDEE